METEGVGITGGSSWNTGVGNPLPTMVLSTIFEPMYRTIHSAKYITLHKK